MRAQKSYCADLRCARSAARASSEIRLGNWNRCRRLAHRNTLFPMRHRACSGEGRSWGDLGLDGLVRFVSPSWQELVGTTPDSVQGKPIVDLLVENKTVFQEGVVSLQKDDSKSQIIRFTLPLGPLSALRRKSSRKESASEGQSEAEDEPELESTISLEAQGIMIYDRASGGESHVSSQIQ